jgi:hypothetical protein
MNGSLDSLADAFLIAFWASALVSAAAISVFGFVLLLSLDSTLGFEGDFFANRLPCRSSSCSTTKFSSSPSCRHQPASCRLYHDWSGSRRRIPWHSRSIAEQEQ